jgi:hypothetical protein
MVSVQADCTPDQALALMTAHAAAVGQAVELIATAVVERALRFDQQVAS